MEVTKEELDKMIKAAVEEKTPAAPKDQRISDLEFFWQIIPHLLGGCITNTQLDTRPAMQKAFLVAREAVGQACMMGLCKPMTVLSDGNQLSMMPSQMGASMPAPNQQPMMGGMGGMGGIVPQQTMPGAGGMVAQYPMNAQNSPHIVGGGGSMGIPAGGMVAQYPMNMDAPMVYGAQSGPMGAPMQGGVRGVMTKQFPMDPQVAATMAPLVNQGPAPGTPQYVAAQAAVPQYPHQQQPAAPQAPPGYPPQGYAQPPQGYAQPQQPQYAPPGYAQPQAQPQVQYGPPPAVPQGFVPAPPQGGFAPVVAPQGQPTQAVAVPPMGPRIG